MSAYDNVVGGKLKLKGKALDVKAAGMKKKKKKQKKDYVKSPRLQEMSFQQVWLEDGGSVSFDDPNKEEIITDAAKSIGEENAGRWDDNLTPAERSYIEQREKIDMHKMAKTANKSHRDRIEDLNQYLSNMSEHYDIPKIGPG
ncbi:hypothetical protein RND71_031231 [Anisodus tanguticus]|uniref:Protein FAM32A n=1 Tax=Anisodus tanguticus TaxID=243964 RepID=A0AAE1V2Z4_9SOLA|nr:hypothetical protein RND71_031231 [Anisodus tanguticus]